MGGKLVSIPLLICRFLRENKRSRAAPAVKILVYHLSPDSCHSAIIVKITTRTIVMMAGNFFWSEHDVLRSTHSVYYG